MSLLEIEKLAIETRSRPLVRGIDLSIEEGEWFSVIGESGSGKTITSLSIANLQAPNLRRSAATLSFDGLDLRKMGRKELRRLRGERIAYVFQDYQGAFTPTTRSATRCTRCFVRTGNCRGQSARTGSPLRSTTSAWKLELRAGTRSR